MNTIEEVKTFKHDQGTSKTGFIQIHHDKQQDNYFTELTVFSSKSTCVTFTVCRAINTRQEVDAIAEKIMNEISETGLLEYLTKGIEDDGRKAKVKKMFDPW